MGPLRAFTDREVAPMASEMRKPMARAVRGANIEREDADERMVAGSPQPGDHEQRTDFVAVEAGGVRFVVQAGPANMHRG